jgi:hypothetical protein
MIIGTLLALVGLVWVSRKAKKEIDIALAKQKEEESLKSES